MRWPVVPANDDAIQMLSLSHLFFLETTACVRKVLREGGLKPVCASGCAASKFMYNDLMSTTRSISSQLLASTALDSFTIAYELFGVRVQVVNFVIIPLLPLYLLPYFVMKFLVFSSLKSVTAIIKLYSTAYELHMDYVWLGR